MVSKSLIEEFLSQDTLALAGVSRSGKGFGNAVLKDLSSKGYTMIPVHPEADSINGFQCYPSVGELPVEVGGLVLVVPPAQSEVLVQQAREAGITRVWMQQGAESDEAIRFCGENGLDVVHGECIMMFAEPKGIHKAHRWLRGVFGSLPSDD